jgi:vancomycin resistance protein VanJ
MAVHYRVRAGREMVSLVNVHLETPRRGIEQFRWGGEVRGLARNILVRDAGSRRTSQWVHQVAPDAIVAGDFNLPPESAIFRRHWGGCGNAFSERGRGFGYTRILPKWSARIDHVLTCGPSWVAVFAVVGPDLGSDHLPVIVDLRRR